jgi:HK97 family phage major capsid protein
MYLLESEVEEQLLAGDGTGQNLNGLIPQSTAYDTDGTQTGDTRIDTLSHALTQLEEADFEPSFVVVHPRDREAMRLIKTEEGAANQGQYVFGDPAARDSASVWSTPMAVTKSMAQGTFLVGDATRGALILDRMESVIDISEHHDDYFARNLVAIRAECRLALVVFREDALIYGAF